MSPAPVIPKQLWSWTREPVGTCSTLCCSSNKLTGCIQLEQATSNCPPIPCSFKTVSSRDFLHIVASPAPTPLPWHDQPRTHFGSPAPDVSAAALWTLCCRFHPSHSRGHPKFMLFVMAVKRLLLTGLAGCSAFALTRPSPERYHGHNSILMLSGALRTRLTCLRYSSAYIIRTRFDQHQV